MPAKRERSTPTGAGRFLVVDAGNTVVHFGVCTPDRITGVFRVPSASPRFIAEGLLGIRSRVRRRGGLGGALVASVVPRLNGPITRICGAVGLAPLFLDHATGAGIALRYRRPAEIGADRIANAIAARELHGAPAIVVDIGTAITFDCVSADGAYLGGVIFPGPRLSCAALAEGTGLLPLVEPWAPPNVIGRSTAHAIRSGAIHGTRALIRGLLGELRREMGGRPKVVFTGGQLGPVIRGWWYPRLVDPLLTLHGLRLVYNRLFPPHGGPALEDAGPRGRRRPRG